MMKLILITILVAFVYADVNSGPIDLDANPNGNDDWEGAFNGLMSLSTLRKLPGPNFADTDGTCDTGCLSDDDIFTTGGSKDIQNINSWRWKSGKPQDKAQLIAGAAASYVNPSDGHVYLYFAADRFANEGDTFLGLWFFKDSVTQTSSGGFTGDHTDEDILVIVNFAGNGVVEIQVYRWDPTCTKSEVESNPATPGKCASNDLRILYINSSAKCGIASNQPACAITNENAIQNGAIWPYASKGEGLLSSGQTYKVATFIEGAIDITDLLGLESGAPCFTSILLETRASTSVSSTLSDFMLGPFGDCSADYNTNCVSSTKFPGYTEHCGNTDIVNTGSSSIYNVKVIVEGDVVQTISSIGAASSATSVNYCVEKLDLGGISQGIVWDSGVVQVTFESAQSGGVTKSASLVNVAECLPILNTGTATAVIGPCVARFVVQNNRVVLGFDFDFETSVEWTSAQLSSASFAGISGQFPDFNEVKVNNFDVGTPFNNGESKKNVFTWFPGSTPSTSPASAEWEINVNFSVNFDLSPFGVTSAPATALGGGNTVTCRPCPE